MKRNVDGPVVVEIRDKQKLNRRTTKHNVFETTPIQIQKCLKGKFLFKSINIIRQTTEKARLWFQSSSSSIKGRFA